MQLVVSICPHADRRHPPGCALRLANDGHDGMNISTHNWMYREAFVASNITSRAEISCSTRHVWCLSQKYIAFPFLSLLSLPDS